VNFAEEVKLFYYVKRIKIKIKECFNHFSVNTQFAMQFLKDEGAGRRSPKV